MTVAGWRVSRRQPCVSCVRSPAALATAPCPFACEPLVDVVAGTRESFAGRREVTRTRSEHSLGNPANLPNAYYATACRYNLFIRCEIRIDCSCRHHTLALRRCRDLIRISCAVARPKTDTRTPSASVHWCDGLQIGSKCNVAPVTSYISSSVSHSCLTLLLHRIIDGIGEHTRQTHQRLYTLLLNIIAC